MNHSTFFTNNFIQVVKIIGCLAKPEGTTIKELARNLRLNRRSIFRILNIIEDRLRIPVIANRETRRGIAIYHLEPSFHEKLSSISIPALSLTFNQALFAYLILKDELLSKEADLAEEFSKVYNAFP